MSKKKNLNKKIALITLVVIVLAVLVGAAVWSVQHSGPAKSTSPAAQAPAIVGALVGIGTSASTYTVKSADGTQKTFNISAQTVILTHVAEGAVGRNYTQMNVGEVVSVIAKTNDPSTAESVEVLPQATAIPAGATAQTISGSVVAISAGSITVKVPNTDPATAITNATTNLTFQITASTSFLTQAMTGGTGMPQSAFVTGSMVRISGYSDAKGNTATSILLLQEAK